MVTMVDCKSGGPISPDLRYLRLDHASLHEEVSPSLSVGDMVGVFGELVAEIT